MEIKNKLKGIPGSWYFLAVVILAYLGLLILQQELFFASIKFFGKIITKIIPVFVVVFTLMVLTNYFITPQFVKEHIQTRGIKKWLFVIIGGILSMGPI